MPNRRTAILILATALTLLGAALAHWSYLRLAQAELVAHDFLARNGRRTETNPKLIFLAIDNASISIDAKSDLENSAYSLRNEDKMAAMAGAHYCLTAVG